ncbi:BREX-1 system adenine-specific DNA-methyltransferase PglX [Agrococcus sp. ProA11]|uniref:BREX-1 system adenine-specific DNA-methyltransferase PglX n=1 Tax=Agrococcus chionoecetis TaxID=3153752 RepID=UPI003260368F
MDTAPLKAFATSARTELIREVGARITAVLAQGSPERVEQRWAVTALERAITGGGGGDNGKAHVADKVAYTWFNRIIALRFMDANGYTGIGVVSPAADQVGQPAVLAAAKRGQVDSVVVKGAHSATITGLLNGTRQPRPGVDAQAESYALLLADYCRYWNAAMPFMFERDGDYTELLIPANLLAEDSVLSRSVKVLTEDVCQDVEVIGWLYQFYISERKQEVFDGFKAKGAERKRAGADEIPAATQLFTPHWIVRYLVENSLGRLWMLNHPESRLIDQLDYYIAPVDQEADFHKITKPEELKVIDPACGSGHMLTYAFDLLYAIYEEEGYTPSKIPSLILTNNLYGIEIDPRAGALAAFALTMKAAAKRKLFLKDPVEPNICVLYPTTFTPDEVGFLVTEDGDRFSEEAFWNQFAEADTFGSLIQPNPALAVRLACHLATLDADGDILRADTLDRAQKVIHQAEYLLPRYAVVVANPPYMGSKNMSSQLVEFAKSKYPSAKTDLYSMFIARNLVLASRGGFVAMITMQSWMFLSTFSALRQKILREFIVATLAHLGAGAFDTIGGEVVSTAAFVIHVQPGEARGVYLRLAGLSGEAVQSRAALVVAAGTDSTLRHEVTSRDLTELPLSSMAYWLSASERHIYRDHPSLMTLAGTRQGLATGDNSRFLRFWWEVSRARTCRTAASHAEAAESRARWFPVQKGGTPRRWVGNDELVVDWESDGLALLNFRPRSVIRNPSYYFRAGATWSSLSGEFAVRVSPEGFLFESKGSMLFPLKNEDLNWILGYLNTPIARRLIDSLSPTLDYHEGPVARIPVIHPARPEEVASSVTSALVSAGEIWARRETSPSFDRFLMVDAPSSVKDALDSDRSARLEAEKRVLKLERTIEEHFRESGSVGPDVFPLAEQRPTGLVHDDLRNDASAARLLAEDLVSYAVGCMFGRYSLDESGLILADQGATLHDYLTKVPYPTFTPDTDNVIPIVDGDWFEDDIVERFRQFLRAAFGEEHFEENLRFVANSLGVKSLRGYFVKSFYKDHWQRYKKRPIYWQFSSPRGSFNALIYMHRYTPSTVSTVLTYLREYVTKLESALQQAERAGNAKEADRLRKILVELNEYEHDTLFPKASENVVFDLDDGVRANYLKFGAALRKIVGMEAASD